MSPIEAFLFLLQETIKLPKNQDEAVKSQMEYLEQFRLSRLVPIYKREKLARQSPFTLCLVGLTNVGKSTLIEALLGAQLAPKKNGPATAVPVEYAHSPNWSLEVLYHDAGTPPQCKEYPDSSALAAEVARHAVNVSTDEAAKIAAVCVKGPMEMLKNNLILADTPGIGAAILDSAAGEDAKAPPTDRWLQRAGRTYLCVAAGVSWKISPEEAILYEAMRHICSNIIVTKWENSDEEQDEWKTTFGRLFPGADFDFVNARRGINVSHLRTIIETQTSLERRLLHTRRELLKAWEDLNRHFEHVFRCEAPWRLDSLQRFRAACLPHAELHKITSELENHACL